MKFFLMLLLSFFSHYLYAESSVIEGVWVLDRDKTERSVRAQQVILPQWQQDNLDASYGKMAYVFRGKQTTYAPINHLPSQKQWMSWSLLEETDNFIHLLIPHFNHRQISFHKSETCLGLIIQKYGYTEYYCRHHSHQFNSKRSEPIASPVQ